MLPISGRSLVAASPPPARLATEAASSFPISTINSPSEREQTRDHQLRVVSRMSLHGSEVHSLDSLDSHYLPSLPTLQASLKVVRLSCFELTPGRRRTHVVRHTAPSRSWRRVSCSCPLTHSLCPRIRLTDSPGWLKENEHPCHAGIAFLYGTFFIFQPLTPPAPP